METALLSMRMTRPPSHSAKGTQGPEQTIWNNCSTRDPAGSCDSLAKAEKVNERKQENLQPLENLSS